MRCLGMCVLRIYILCAVFVGCFFLFIALVYIHNINNNQVSRLHCDLHHYVEDIYLVTFEDFNITTIKITFNSLQFRVAGNKVHHHIQYYGRKELNIFRGW